MTNEITTGKCLCESIKFKIHGNPLWVSNCHCQGCRRNTGSVVATFVGLRKEQLSYITGSRKFYESSPDVHHGFCADCRTPLTYEASWCEDEMHLYISTFDNPEILLQTDMYSLRREYLGLKSTTICLDLIHSKETRLK